MARNLTVATVLEKNALASGTPFLVLLDVVVIDPLTGNEVEHMYLANNNEDFDYGGNTYVAIPFTIGLKQESGTQPTVTLSITDYTNVIQQKVQQYQGAVGFTVVVMVVNSDLPAPPEVSETFEVIGSSSAEYVVNFTLGAESALTKAFPKRRQMRDFCAWRYKGGECKYEGAMESCDLSLNGPNGCDAHNNTINFGGYPGITGGARYG
jgi:phage-related protein